MASKYQALPDISESILGDDETPAKLSNGGIDISTLPDRRKAERVFGRGTRRSDPKNLPFRPRLPPHPNAYASSSTSSDSEPEYTQSELPRRKESAIARIRRLKIELAELEREVSQPQGGGLVDTGRIKRKSVLVPKEPLDLMAEVAGLRERLVGIDEGEIPLGAREVDGDWGERLGRLKHHEEGAGGSSDNANGELRRDDGEQGADTTPGLSELDKRLASLEGLIGPPDTGGENPSSPLVPTLSKLSHLLTLLTQPRHLDSISRRIKLLLVDLDRANTTTSRRPRQTQTSTSNPNPPNSNTTQNTTMIPAEHAQLSEIFAILPRLDPLIPIIPPLLARLRSLAVLHAQAGEVLGALKRLEEGGKRGEEDVKELRGVVKGVKEGLGVAIEGMGRNWEGLEGRLKSVEERMKALNAG